TVSDNRTGTGGGQLSDAEGGGFYLEEGTVSITSSTISGNSADNGLGGGIYMVGGAAVQIEISNNSTISGNTAARGAGLYASNGTFSVVNLTLADNTATEEGGGIYAQLSATFAFENTIVGTNTPDNCYRQPADDGSGQTAIINSSGNNVDSD